MSKHETGSLLNTTMNKQIIKYGAALVAAMFALSSCHWHNYDHGVRYVEHPVHHAQPVVVHHVDHKPKHHKPKKHVKRHAPAPKHKHNSKPVFHKGPHHRR